MLIARNSSAQLIIASKADKTGNYICPGCESPVILKKGTRVTAHFAHVNKNSCSSFSEGETEEHLKGKTSLYEAFKQENVKVEIEAQLTDINQRPDVLVSYKGEEYAIEFQCSPITVSDIVRRTRGYHNSGRKVIWIAGNKLTNTHRLTSLQRAMIFDIKPGVFGFFNYDVSDGQIRCYRKFDPPVYETVPSVLSVLTKYESTIWCSKISPGNDKNIKDKALVYLNWKRQIRDKRHRAFFQLIYESQTSLELLPLVIFTRLETDWLISTPAVEWKLRIYQLVRTKSSFTVITERHLRATIERWIETRLIVYFSVPNILSDTVMLPILSFLDQMTESGLLVKIQKNKWRQRS